MPQYRGPRDGPRVITKKNIGKDFTKPVKNSRPAKPFGSKEQKRVEKRRRLEEKA